MITEETYTKENIKNRLFKRVAALWDVRDIDHLDPVVKLMIEALAGEIFRLSGEHRHIETRILEKIAHTLTPGSLIPAHPAHAIMHARPICSELVIDTATEFHYKNAQFLKRHNLKRLAFSPVCSPRLVDGALKYMIDASGCYAMDGRGGKDLVARPLHYHPDMNQAVWLGFDLAADIDSLNQLSFYIDFPHIDNKADYFQLLPYTQWSTAHESLFMKTGLGAQAIVAGTPGSDKYDVRHRINQEVMERYQHRFLTVAHHQGKTDQLRSKFAPAINTLYDASLMQDISESTVWIRASFPPLFTPDVLRDMTIHMNAFPVANKYLHSIERKIEQLASVVPLTKEANEYLLAVETVSDANGITYHEIPDKRPDAPQQAAYALRRGGCERFDSTDARDYLERLTDLLRDESMAFANVEKDTLGENALDLLKQLNHLEHKTNLGTTSAESLSYIIPEADLQEPLSFFVSYWLTNGDVANGIRSGELLGFTEVNDIDRTSTYLLTATREGSEAPGSKQRIDLFKHALTSSGAIYTHDDIVSFCKAHYGKLIQQTNVARGYAVSNTPGQGVVRTIDVCITPNPGMPQRDISALTEDLLAALQQRSPDSFHYRVKVV